MVKIKIIVLVILLGVSSSLLAFGRKGTETISGPGGGGEQGISTLSAADPGPGEGSGPGGGSEGG